MNEESLLEHLASLEHEQWVEWANYCIQRKLVDQETVDKWEPLMVSYEALSEADKEKDRLYARKIIDKLKEFFD